MKSSSNGTDLNDDIKYVIYTEILNDTQIDYICVVVWLTCCY